jgi:hypothetical protein
MVTKIEAAQLASRSGVTTIIAAGREPNVLTRIIAGEEIGTRFEAAADHLESRKRWLLAEKPRGEIMVDAGAARAILKRGMSLLPVGITEVNGEFGRGAHLAVQSPDGKRIAQGSSKLQQPRDVPITGGKVHRNRGYPRLYLWRCRHPPQQYGPAEVTIMRRMIHGFLRGLAVITVVVALLLTITLALFWGWTLAPNHRAARRYVLTALRPPTA